MALKQRRIQADSFLPEISEFYNYTEHGLYLYIYLFIFYFFYFIFCRARFYSLVQYYSLFFLLLFSSVYRPDMTALVDGA